MIIWLGNYLDLKSWISYDMSVRAILKTIRQLCFNDNWWYSRAILMTIGQLCFYDQIKQTLLASGLFGDNLVTHFTSSLGAVEILFFSWNIKTLFSKWLNNFSQGAIATTMTQPLDVLKTRSMNAKPGFFLSRLHFKFISAGSVCLYLNFLFLTFSISQESSPAQ